MGVANAATPYKLYSLDLSKPAEPVEYNSDGYWSETYNPAVRSVDFGSGIIFRFSHCNTGFGGTDVGDSMSYWDGFSFSHNGDDYDYGSSGSSDGWVAHQWGCMAGGGIAKDENGNIIRNGDGDIEADIDAPYAVAYWSGSSECNRIELISDTEQLFAAKGIYICAHPWPYYGILYGDGFSRPFTEEDDFFSVTIHGLGSDGKANGKSVTHLLAAMNDMGDGTFEPEQSSSWEWVDLSPLGNISGVYFTMNSSDVNPTFGINTAAYFCVGGMEVESLTQHSGVEEVLYVSPDEPNPATEWYTLEGRRISTPTLPGIYLKRSGNKVTKVKIRKLI